MNEDNVLTLGELRRLSEGMPDDTLLAASLCTGGNGGPDRWRYVKGAGVGVSGNIPGPPDYLLVLKLWGV